MQNATNASASRKKLLFIDDSRSQLSLYRKQLDQVYEVRTASNYGDAMAELSSHQPDLIVLDLVMPQVDGLEFLDILKATESFLNIPVVMVSAENDPSLVRQAFLKGAGDFVRKPYDEEELRLRIHRLLSLPTRGVNPQERMASQVLTARLLVIKALTDLAATRDNETGFHLKRIEHYTGLLALAAAQSELYADQISETLLETIGEVSVLHDIGKVGIPDSILKKPGKLDFQEFEIMKTHTTLGAETLHKVREGFPDQAFLDLAIQIAHFHHERWDGTGYPTGLAADNIPLAARIVGIVDVFDALTTARVYKPAFGLEKTLEIMKEGRGTHFDPVLFGIFLDCVPQFTDALNRMGEIGHETGK